MPIKPTDQEEEYFARQEFERLQCVEHERQQKLARDEKERLQKLHHMQCPKCGMQLVEIDYRHIKIDRCTECEGIWLDKGELQEIMKFDSTVLKKLFSIFKK